MPRRPLLPSNRTDPTGVARLEAGARNDFARRMKRIGAAYVAALDRFEARLVINARYSFQLDQVLLQSVFADLDALVASILLEGGEGRLWFFEQYVGVAYQRGTAQQFANLSRQSAAYNAGQESITRMLQSEPYRARIALIRAREYEEMRGLSGNVRANMGRVLTDGMARGLNPREIAGNLTEQAGIETRRAARIARTEIPTALRRARLDESDDARERYALQTKEMHLAALLPTTRASHARRHGRLFTTDEVREWYSVDGNSINCRCGQVSILVDAKGEPLIPGLVEKERELYRKRAELENMQWAPS